MSNQENEPTRDRSPKELSEFVELEEFPECRKEIPRSITPGPSWTSSVFRAPSFPGS